MTIVLVMSGLRKSASTGTKDMATTNIFKREHVATCVELGERNPDRCRSEGEKTAGKSVCTRGMLAAAVVHHFLLISLLPEAFQ